MMKWFEGSINEAVSMSKSKKAIFVVFIEGKDDTSIQIARTIDVAEVSSKLEQEDFVSVRLESDSEMYRYFTQMYRLVPVPSLFFIGNNGIPLEVIAGNMTAKELVSKIDSVLDKVGKSKKNSSVDLIKAEQNATQPADVPSPSVNDTVSSEAVNIETSINADLTPEKSTAETTEDNSNKAQSTKDESSVNSTEAEAPSTSTENKLDNSTMELTSEEKLERARQLIELQRKQRVEEEEQKAKEREIERRKVGQDVQKLRRKQHDLEMKQAYEETMREKAADAVARERVRQQIAQDKIERKQKELALQQQQQQQQLGQEQSKIQKPLTSEATVTRIQFKLPSGNPYTGQFSPTSTLRDLRTYVVENIELPFRQFIMSTSFPRRELTNKDDNKTLIELELVPTAVILILPIKNSNTSSMVTSSQDANPFSRFMWSFFAPIISIYNYLMGYFFGGTYRNTEDQSSTDETNNSNGTATSNFQSVTQALGRNVGNQGGTTIRAQGNVHRLHSGRDDNDENNTWNGNSTQQM